MGILQMFWAQPLKMKGSPLSLDSQRKEENEGLVSYWGATNSPADALALPRTQVMGELNHQDNEVQEGN